MLTVFGPVKRRASMVISSFAFCLGCKVCVAGFTATQLQPTRVVISSGTAYGLSRMKVWESWAPRATVPKSWSVPPWTSFSAHGVSTAAGVEAKNQTTSSNTAFLMIVHPWRGLLTHSSAADSNVHGKFGEGGIFSSYALEGVPGAAVRKQPMSRRIWRRDFQRIGHFV